MMLPFSNNASSSFIEQVAFDGISGSFSQLLASPDYCALIGIALSEELFLRVPVNGWTKYFSSVILEGRNLDFWRLLN